MALDIASIGKVFKDLSGFAGTALGIVGTVMNFKEADQVRQQLAQQQANNAAYQKWLQQVTNQNMTAQAGYQNKMLDLATKTAEEDQVDPAMVAQFTSIFNSLLGTEGAPMSVEQLNIPFVNIGLQNMDHAKEYELGELRKQVTTAQQALADSVGNEGAKLRALENLSLGAVEAGGKINAKYTDARTKYLREQQDAWTKMAYDWANSGRQFDTAKLSAVAGMYGLAKPTDVNPVGVGYLNVAGDPSKLLQDRLKQVETMTAGTASNLMKLSQVDDSKDKLVQGYKDLLEAQQTANKGATNG